MKHWSVFGGFPGDEGLFLGSFWARFWPVFRLEIRSLFLTCFWAHFVPQKRAKSDTVDEWKQEFVNIFRKCRCWFYLGIYRSKRTCGHLTFIMRSVSSCSIFTFFHTEFRSYVLSCCSFNFSVKNEVEKQTNIRLNFGVENCKIRTAADGPHDKRKMPAWAFRLVNTEVISASAVSKKCARIIAFVRLRCSFLHVFNDNMCLKSK